MLWSENLLIFMQAICARRKLRYLLFIRICARDGEGGGVSEENSQYARQKKMEIYSVPIYDCVCETAARFVILHIIIIIIIRMFITFIYGIFGMLYCWWVFFPDIADGTFPWHGIVPEKFHVPCFWRSLKIQQQDNEASGEDEPSERMEIMCTACTAWIMPRGMRSYSVCVCVLCVKSISIFNVHACIRTWQIRTFSATQQQLYLMLSWKRHWIFLHPA